MSRLPIKIYPDPVLREKAGLIKKITPEIKKLASDMIETMIGSDGVGLAGPQVGEGGRIFVLNIGQGRLVFINPEIIKRNGREAGHEGCLSLPGINLKIRRAKKIRCRFLDAKGKPQELEAGGLLARVIQHENDHLDGILIIDKLGFFKRRQLLKQLVKEP